MAGLPFTYVPPTGWDALEAVQITVGNQDQFPSVAACSLLAQHAKQVSGPSGNEYVPPTGWWVVMIEHRDTRELDQVWISPTGDVAIQVGACTGAKMGSAGASVHWAYWVLAGLGVAFVLIPLFKKE